MNFEDPTKVIIEQKKVVEYLLNVAHPDGSGKARFFRKCGFHPDNWEYFAKNVVEHGQTSSEVYQVETKFGKKIVLEGNLKTPLRGEVFIRSIWILIHKSPILVTLYPLKND